MGMTSVEGQMANLDFNDRASGSSNASGSDNYVHVDPKSSSESHEMVSVKSTERWTEELLKDPKVSVGPHGYVPLSTKSLLLTMHRTSSLCLLFRRMSL